MVCLPSMSMSVLISSAKVWVKKIPPEQSGVIMSALYKLYKKIQVKYKFLYKISPR